MNATHPTCPVCHITVAPFDPERVQKELYVYHRPCLRKKEAADQKAEADKMRLYHQLTYGRVA